MKRWPLNKKPSWGKVKRAGHEFSKPKNSI